MRLTILVLTLVVATAFAGSAMAVPPGKTVEWEAKGGPGKVIFEGNVHADKGFRCNDCHTKIFQMKKGTAIITMTELNAGKFCGVCHNGTKAFATKNAANCAKCHKK